MNFSLDYDNVHSQSFVANRHSQAGEHPIYMAPMDANTFRLQLHCLLAESGSNRQRDCSGWDRFGRYKCRGRVPDLGEAVGEAAEHFPFPEISLFRSATKDLSRQWNVLQRRIPRLQSLSGDSIA